MISTQEIATAFNIFPLLVRFSQTRFNGMYGTTPDDYVTVSFPNKVEHIIKDVFKNYAYSHRITLRRTPIQYDVVEYLQHKGYEIKNEGGYPEKYGCRIEFHSFEALADFINDLDSVIHNGGIKPFVRKEKITKALE